MNSGVTFSCCLFIFMHWIYVKASEKATEDGISPRDRAREMLLRNSLKFHKKIDPNPCKFDDDWIVFNRTASLLDAKDLFAFAETSERAKSVVAQEIGYRLKAFNEYFVFEEDWFNALVYKILNDNFPSDLTLRNPETRDYAALMACKYAFKEHRKLNTPVYIYFGIMSFIFEAVFGKGYIIPTDSEAQLIHFLGQQVQMHDLPRTLEYFSGAISAPPLTRGKRSDYFNETYENQLAINLLTFLATRPSPEAHQTFNLLLFDVLRTGYASKTHYILYEERLEVPFDADEPIEFGIREVCSLKLVATNIFNRFPGLNNQHFVASESNWFKPLLFKNFGLRSNDPGKDYLCSIDYDSLFSAEIFEVLSNDSKFELVKFINRTNAPFILKWDILSKYKCHLGGPIDESFHLYNYPKLEILDLMTYEGILPVDLRRISFMKMFLSSDVYSKYYDIYLLAFKRMLPRDNPLLPVLLLGKRVLCFKNCINEKQYDLGVLYKFGQVEIKTFWNVQYSSDSGENWHTMDYGLFDLDFDCKRLVELGKTMSFLEVLEFLNIPELFEAFHT